ncbi:MULTISPECIES: hypothetical protein [Nitrospirillum]|uniref:Uncharacterized protein n=1 Tax=Nitrospirillum amazonense TaxID=28077 RepID=A0A560F641_9PROT|nr:hypothetical protein [Nitrospirillum amazonense]MEC4593512.1 hypothetical protein [Nitrospirillum amazonense]TWB17035.1 hypothetical protein FBZ88_12732 [Nitrospirillum amazonense]
MTSLITSLTRRLSDRGLDLAVLVVVSAFLTLVVLSAAPDATVDEAQAAPAGPAQLADGQAGH